MRLVRFALVVGVAAILGGCSMNADTTATEEQEKAYRNPPKEMPAEARQAMENASKGPPK